MNRVMLPKAGMTGYFKIQAFKGEKLNDGFGRSWVREIPGTRRILADWFPNLVLDAGLNEIGTRSDWLAFCSVGSGSTSPVVGDTALETFVATTSTRQSRTFGAQGSAPYYGYERITYRFGEGVAAGNLSEVGAGWTPGTGSTLFTRSLIVDGGGSPTTITVLSDEYLDVTYELRSYPILSDISSNVSITGSGSHAYVIRAASVTAYTTNHLSSFAAGLPPGASVAGFRAYNGAIGAITAGPAGTFSNATSVAQDAYVNESLERDLTVTYGLDEGNVSGISAVIFNMTLGKWQMSLNPVIDKQNTDILTLDYTVSWDRYTPP